MSDRLPLAGLLAVEIGHSLAGPFACSILADLGATVVKVESAGKGDHARDWGVRHVAGSAALFHAVNHGKRSVVANLREPADAAALSAFIVDRADIVVQNLRAGALDAVGLDGATLTAAKPSLVYCNVGAFGRAGPLRDAPGYDPLIQAASGLMSMLGNPGEPPSRVPVAINDMGTGIWAVVGILSALLKRKETGRGGIVDVSLYETALTWMAVPLSDYMATGELPERLGSGVANIVPYQTFDCADGVLLIAAGNDLLFGRLCRVLGVADLPSDPRFATNVGRVANRRALIPLLAPLIRTRKVAELAQVLMEAGVPCGPVNSVDAALSSPQTKALDIIQTTPEHGVRTLALPVSFDGRRPPLAGRTPALGEHQDMIATSQEPVR